MKERWEISEDDRPGMEWNQHIYITGTDDRVCFMAHGDDAAKNKERAELIARAPEMEEEIERLKATVALIGLELRSGSAVHLERQEAALRAVDASLERASNEKHPTMDMSPDQLRAIVFREPPK